MEKVAKYFGSYLTAIAAVVAVFPVTITNFGAFPLPSGEFASVFGFMCTVSNYFVIALTIFHLDWLRRMFSLPENASERERALSRSIKTAPIILFILFLACSVVYAVGQDEFRRSVFVNDGLTISSTNIFYVCVLTVMFIGPVIALSLMGSKHVIDSSSIS